MCVLVLVCRPVWRVEHRVELHGTISEIIAYETLLSTITNQRQGFGDFYSAPYGVFFRGYRQHRFSISSNSDGTSCVAARGAHLEQQTNCPFTQ